MSDALAFPLACFVGLLVAGTEVTSTGYARQRTTLAYLADGVTVANVAPVQWPVALYDWGVIDGVLVQDAAAGGNRIALLSVLAPVEIRQYDAARIPAAGIILAPVNGVYSAAIAPGVFGAFGLGGADGGPGGVFSTRGYDMPTFRGALALGVFGRDGYGAVDGVPLERAFDQQHVCAPGVWAPGPCALAA